MHPPTPLSTPRFACVPPLTSREVTWHGSKHGWPRQRLREPYQTAPRAARVRASRRGSRRFGRRARRGPVRESSRGRGRPRSGRPSPSCSPSDDPMAVMALMQPIRPPARVLSNLRRMRTLRLPTWVSRCHDVRMPAASSRSRAVASQAMTSHESLEWGNFAMARPPSPSRTEALGRVPPRPVVPVSRSRVTASEGSSSEASSSLARRSAGRATSRGTREDSPGNSSLPGIRKRRAPWRMSSLTPKTRVVLGSGDQAQSRVDGSPRRRQGRRGRRGRWWRPGREIARRAPGRPCGESH